jgi:ADP-ribose pyrophosphatase YjhB (NUDIX family)
MSKKSLFYPYTIDNIHPGFSVDCVILSFHKKKLRVLLNKFDISKYWRLPGGFMFKNESSDDAAKRILAERTGLSGIYLKQFHVFSDPNRTIMEQNATFLKKNAGRCDVYGEEDKWFLQRFVSLGYYAFVKYENVQLTKAEEDSVKWFDIGCLPLLYSDHENIIKTSLETIHSLLPVVPVGYELLPEKFTLSELRKIYEIFSGKTLDRRNFKRKALAGGAIIQLDEIKNTSSYNPPILYTFDEDKKNRIDHSFI